MDAPMRYDEAYTVTGFASRGFRHVVSDYSLPNNHIFHTLLVSGVAGLAGIDPAFVRLPAFAAGVLQVPVVFLVWSRISTAAGGLLAASFVAGSAALVDYSVNARGYTIAALLAVVALGVAVEIRRSTAPVGLLLCFWTVAALGLWTVPVFVYALAGVLLWLLVADGGRPLRRRVSDAVLAGAGSVVGAVVLYSPVLRNDPGSLLGNRFVQPQPLLEFLRAMPAFLVDVVTMWTRMVPVPLVAVVILGLATAMVSRRLPAVRALAWSTIASVTVLLLAQHVVPYPRTWLVLLPVWIGISAAGVAAWAPNVGGRVAHTAVATSVVAVAVTAWLVVAVLAGPGPLTGRGFRHAEEIALELRERAGSVDDVVAVRPATAQLHYYLVLHEVPVEIVTQGGEVPRRVLLVTALEQTVQEVLDAAGLRQGGVHDLVATYPSGSLWELAVEPASR